MDVYRACLGCGEPTPAPRCPDCQAEVDRNRGGATARGYTRQWERKAAAVRREDKVCALCGTTDDLTVDHVVPKSLGGTDERSNLRVLCRSHNSSGAGQGWR